jgi:hypothetical protein
VGTWFNSAGLVLDIIGAVLLWLYALPEVIQRAPQGHFFGEPPPASELEKARRYDRNAKVGLLLLITGFALQLVSNYLPA